MEFNITDLTEEVCNNRMNWVKHAYESKRKLDLHAPALQNLLLLCGENVRASMWTDKLEVTIKVTDMKAITPFLEAFQNTVGADFDSTSDETTYGKTRTFSMSKFPLTIIADVADADENANCKAVKVGEQIVPIYKLQCD